MAKKCNHKFVRCFENFRCSACGKIFTPAQRDEYEAGLKEPNPNHDVGKPSNEPDFGADNGSEGNNDE